MPEDSLFPDRYREWIARHKLLGVDDAALVRVLTEGGIEERVAASEVRAAGLHPYIRAGKQFGNSLLRMEALLDTYRALAALQPSYGQVERRPGLSPEDFLDEYYAANRPVILPDLMRNWKAVWRWTPDYLKEACGDTPVEIFGAREADARYALNMDRHRRSMRFAEYVDLVVSGPASNDYYMEGNNHAFQQQGMHRLLDDVELFPGFLDPEASAESVFLWFGPSGTVTPLHRDLTNAFLAQVRGRKRILLVPSFQAHRVYSEYSLWSQVDAEHPDYERFPLFRGADLFEVVLEPGEVLFLPVAWWHHVRALEVSISISLIHFVWPNRYPALSTADR